MFFPVGQLQRSQPSHILAGSFQAKSGQSVSWSSVPSLTKAQQVHSVAFAVLCSGGCLSSGSRELDSLSMERLRTIVFSNPPNNFLINTTVKLVLDTYWKSGWGAAVQREITSSVLSEVTVKSGMIIVLYKKKISKCMFYVKSTK